MLYIVCAQRSKPVIVTLITIIEYWQRNTSSAIDTARPVCYILCTRLIIMICCSQFIVYCHVFTDVYGHSLTHQNGTYSLQVWPVTDFLTAHLNTGLPLTCICSSRESVCHWFQIWMNKRQILAQYFHRFLSNVILGGGGRESGCIFLNTTALQNGITVD